MSKAQVLEPGPTGLSPENPIFQMHDQEKGSSTTLGLSFLICEMVIIVEAISKDTYTVSYFDVR